MIEIKEIQNGNFKFLVDAGMSEPGQMSMVEGHVPKWLHGFEFKLEEQKALARLHAHLCGDGCVYLLNEKRNKADIDRYNRKNRIKKVYAIRYDNQRQELLQEFKDDMKLLFPWVKFSECRSNIICVRDKKIFEFLSSISNYDSRSWSIPEGILEANDATKEAWLRAFFDDEGTVDIKRKEIRVSSINKEGIDSVFELLKSIGFNKMRKYHFESISRIDINEVNRFKSLIGFNHRLKKEKLNKICVPT